MTDNEIYLRSEAEKSLREASYQRKRAERYQRECERLRMLAKFTLLCSEGDVRCEGCPLRDGSANGLHVVCSARKLARELKVEVDG